MSDIRPGGERRYNADAFIALCAPYESMIYRHCLEMLRNEEDAQDAAQETMLRAYRAMDAFHALSGVGTWLYRIAHNVCLDWLKRPANRARALSLEALHEGGFEPGDARPTPEEDYLSRSDRERLKKAIARLPEDMRVLLSLRYGDGMSYEELAEALKMNPGTVKSRLSRAREKLRRLFS